MVVLTACLSEAKKILDTSGGLDSEKILELEKKQKTLKKENRKTEPFNIHTSSFIFPALAKSMLVGTKMIFSEHQTQPET